MDRGTWQTAVHGVAKRWMWNAWGLLGAWGGGEWGVGGVMSLPVSGKTSVQASQGVPMLCDLEWSVTPLSLSFLV